MNRISSPEGATYWWQHDRSPLQGSAIVWPISQGYALSWYGVAPSGLSLEKVLAANPSLFISPSPLFDDLAVRSRNRLRACCRGLNLPSIVGIDEGGGCAAVREIVFYLWKGILRLRGLCPCGCA